MPELTQSLLLVLTAMSNLTELRLVTDNGQFSIEPVLRKMFDPRRHTFPTVKSLYVRTAINMAKTFPCFPNLEAINFNLHGMVNNATTRRLSKELAVLRKSKLPIRTLVIHKTGSGWVPADITSEFRLFKILLISSCTSSHHLTNTTPKQLCLSSSRTLSASLSKGP